MVKFSKQFEGQLVPEWKEAFVDYWQLKKDLKKMQKPPNEPSRPSIGGALLTPITMLARSLGYGHVKDHDVIQAYLSPTLSLSLSLKVLYPLLSDMVKSRFLKFIDYSCLTIINFDYESVFQCFLSLTHIVVVCGFPPMSDMVKDPIQNRLITTVGQ